MRILPAIRSISMVRATYNIAAPAPLRGTNVLTGVTSSFALSDVTSNVFQTLLLNKYRIEDIGFVNVLEIKIRFAWSASGSGQWRWQISGDGGTTWVTVADITTNESPFQVEGAGTWISSIQTGDDKFQVRFQARAVTGTVSTAIFDVRISGLADSFITLIYEKRDKVT